MGRTWSVTYVSDILLKVASLWAVPERNGSCPLPPWGRQVLKSSGSYGQLFGHWSSIRHALHHQRRFVHLVVGSCRVHLDPFAGLGSVGAYAGSRGRRCMPCYPVDGQFRCRGWWQFPERLELIVAQPFSAPYIPSIFEGDCPIAWMFQPRPRR